MLQRIIFLLASNCFERKSFCVFPLFLLCLASQFGYSQNSPKPNAPEIAALELNKPIERKLTGGLEKHSYHIKLNAGQYAKILIEQTEADINARLFGSDGSFVTEYNNEIRLGQSESVEFVTGQEVRYRVEIQATSKSDVGLYKIRLTEVRDAADRDRALFEAHTLREKAANLRSAGKYDESLRLTTRALEISEKELGKDHIFVARILDDLGSTQTEKGNYQVVLPLLQRAYSINEKTLGTEHPQTVESYKSIAAYYQKTREYAAAEKAYREIVETCERVFGKEHKILASALSGLGLLMIDLEDTAQAENIVQRARRIAEKYFDSNSLTMRNIVNQLGIIYLVRKEYDKAGQNFQKVLEISEKMGITESPGYYASLLNLAIIYVNQKEYKKALEMDERALIMGEKMFGKESPNVGILLNNIANIYKATGNYEKALEIQRQAFDIGEKSVGPSHRLMMLVIANIAKIYAAQGDIANAVAYQKLWDERFEKAISLDMLIGSERQKLAYANTFPPRTSRTITLHLNLAKNSQEALDLGALVVLQRKGRVLDAVTGNLTALRQRATAEDRELLDRLNKISTELAKLTINKPAKISLDEYRKQLTDLEAQKEKTEREISNQGAEISVQSPIVTLDTIKAEIPSDAALIEFAIYRPYDSKAENNNEAYAAPRYIAYILQKNNAVKFTEIGDKETIDKAVNDLRKVLRDPQRKDIRQFARIVDEKVMQPIRASLGGAKHLLISPDGELNLIPFQALVDEKGHYLIENYSFDYLTSGRDLLRMKVARESKNKSLVIANPEFNKSVDGQSIQKADGDSNCRSITVAKNLSDTSFAPLAATMLEARSIQNLFPDWTFLTGAEATESSLKKITAPRILHIATHGFFLEDEKIGGEFQPTTDNSSKQNEIENPLLRSGLALAGANQRDGVKDDGILTALEASGLNLWGTKLVVLSACDTGLGEVKNGEGVYGLRRAFVLAGTESLVMSLWSVSDNVTRELMTNYYKNLKQGMGRGASLRQVQLAMLKRANRQHPFYWAGFIQSGEWANLDGNR